MSHCPLCSTPPISALLILSLLQISLIAIVDRANQLDRLPSLDPFSRLSGDAHCSRSDHQEVDEFLQSMQQAMFLPTHTWMSLIRTINLVLCGSNSVSELGTSLKCVTISNESCTWLRNQLQHCPL